METEEDYDEVAVFEGERASDAAELSRLSGHNIPPTTVETSGRTALIQFTSDEDVAGVPLTLRLLGQPHPPCFCSRALSLSPARSCCCKSVRSRLLMQVAAAPSVQTLGLRYRSTV